MKRKPKPAPFTVHKHVLDVESAIWHDGKHFMTLGTKEGAERLAQILNAAFELATDHHLLSPNASEALNRSRIAHAVAKAMGGAIDYDSFAERPARNRMVDRLPKIESTPGVYVPPGPDALVPRGGPIG